MKRFKNILLVTDLRPGSKNALNRAVALAERNKAKLTVVDVIDELPSVIQKIFAARKQESFERELFDQRSERLKESLKIFKKKVPDISWEVLKGRGFVEVVRKVKKGKHDLVIIPPAGKTKFQDHVFGSMSMHLMRKCPCPVWVVKSTRKSKYFRILAAVKLSEYQPKIAPLNIKIMELATSLAQWDGCKLDVIFCWYLQEGRYLRDLSSEERKQLRQETQKAYRSKMKILVERFKQEGHQFKASLKEGEASRTIPEIVKKSHIDLLIMGTLSRTGISGLLIGNTAEGILQQVDCSVLTIKPDGFKTPIK